MQLQSDDNHVDILTQLYIDTVCQLLNRNAISVQCFAGLSGWRDLTLEFNSEAPLARHLDPELFDLTESNSGWILLEQNRSPVAWVAMRHDIIDDYKDYIAKGYLWSPKHHRETVPLPNFRFPPERVNISGSIVHSGGAYLQKTHRKQEYGGARLSAHFTRLIRAHGITRFQPDWLTGQLISDALISREFGTKYYGYSHSFPISVGYFPYTNDERNVWLNCSSINEQMMDFRKELCRFWLQHDD